MTQNDIDLQEDNASSLFVVGRTVIHPDALQVPVDKASSFDTKTSFSPKYNQIDQVTLPWIFNFHTEYLHYNKPLLTEIPFGLSMSKFNITVGSLASYYSSLKCIDQSSLSLNSPKFAGFNILIPESKVKHIHI